jgi:hypothetical protein
MPGSSWSAMTRTSGTSASAADSLASGGELADPAQVVP